MSDIKKKAKDIIEELEKNKPKYSIDEKAAFKTGHVVTKVPVNQYSHNPKEDDLSLMKEIRTNIDPDGKLIEGLDPEKYFSIWKDKYDEYERLNFYRWAFSQIDKDDPYQISKLHEFFPEFYQDAEKQIEETAQLYERLADINYRGLKSRDDWLTAYNISNGKIQFDSDVLEKIMGIKSNDISLQEQYEYGLLNPKRYRKMKYEQEVAPIDPFRPFDDSGSINNKEGKKELKIRSFTDVLSDSFKKFF